MIPVSAVKDIMRQIVAQKGADERALPAREWLEVAAALREAFALASVIWDGPSPIVFVVFSRHTARLEVRVPQTRPKPPRRPGIVLSFDRTKPGFGRASRAVSR